MAVGQQQVLVSREGGQYLCTARNKHGSQNSSTVTIHIEGELQNITMCLVRIYKDHERLNSCFVDFTSSCLNLCAEYRRITTVFLIRSINF